MYVSKVYEMPVDAYGDVRTLVRGGIVMDLHVTYLTGIIFWTFNSMHQSEFVFHLTQETAKQPKTKDKKSAWRDQGVKKSEEPSAKNTEPDSSATEEQCSRPLSISEEVFAKFISENIGCDILNAPNSSWSYDTTDFLGNGKDMYETYIFKKRVPNNLKCSEIQANVVKGKSVNFCLDFKMSKREIYDFVYRYKKLFYPNYTFAECKKEYASEQFSIYTEGITPSLDIRFPFMGDPCSMVFYTSFCNTAYVEKKKGQKKILTLEK